MPVLLPSDTGWMPDDCRHGVCPVTAGNEYLAVCPDLSGHADLSNSRTATEAEQEEKEKNQKQLSAVREKSGN